MWPQKSGWLVWKLPLNDAMDNNLLVLVLLSITELKHCDPFHYPKHCFDYRKWSRPSVYPLGFIKLLWFNLPFNSMYLSIILQYSQTIWKGQSEKHAIYCQSTSFWLSVNKKESWLTGLTIDPKSPYLQLNDIFSSLPSETNLNQQQIIFNASTIFDKIVTNGWWYKQT